MSIKIITEPTVKVVGESSVDRDAMAAWLSSCGVGSWESDAPGDGERLIEFAARSCYWSFERPRPGGNAAMLGNLIASGHGSCLEHAVYTIAIAGVSRSLTHELIRHRHLSPSQLSQRFHDESDAAFVTPPLYLPRSGETIDLGYFRADQFPDHATYKRFGVWSDHVWESLRFYEALVESGESAAVGTLARKRVREAARSVLPNCVETRIVLTGNARAWRGVCEQRGTIHADLEIRRLAVVLVRLLQGKAPHLFADAEVFIDTDGRESVRFGHHKV